ncbi:hypothetical protein Efla_004309 [Eimeria flavescens]
MDIPGVRPRMASPSFDFDLENAPFKAHSSEDRQKNQSVVEYLKQASRLWLALAACIIFIFFCVSSSYMPSSPRPPATHYHPGVTPVARSSSGLGGQDAGSHHPHPDHLHSKHVAGHKHHHPHAAAAAAAAQYKEQLQKHALHEVPQQEDLEALHAEEEEEEETVPADEEEEEEEEHADSDSHEDEGNEHFAEAHPEYSLSHDGLFDESKQHPDEPEYVDIWDGVTQEDLHLSSGVPGLKTPLYRLPFLDGQHNHSHVLGVYAKQVFMPRYLKVSGGKRLPLISGTYKMLMVPDGRPKPHLNHGRLIWRQSAPASPVYLYYDHMHHTWLFGTALDLRAPKPLAFLAHGAMLPIHRQHDKSFRKYGVPKSVHWIVRSEGGSKPDSSIKVEADPARSSGGDHLQPLLLQKVYHSPEDGTLEHDGEFDEDNFALFEEENEEEMEEEEEDEQEVPLDANGEPAHLPLGARTFQQFLTHLKTSVYHTFDTLHPKYNHDKILEDPIAFVEGNPHPDLVGPETLDGYGHEPTPHPLRTPASGNDEH